MPVIDPLRLSKQIRQCFANQSDAQLFVTAIKNLLETYADHTYRAGELVSLPSSLKSYHVPQPLTRTLKRELASLSQSQPTQALSVAEVFWDQPFQECKDLAISILENLPTEMEKEFFRTLEQWASSCTQAELIESIAKCINASVHAQQPANLIGQAQKWMLDERSTIRKLGFLVVEQLCLSISFGDLPLIFKLISPYLNRCPPQNAQDVIAICNNLIVKSPKEMAYLMRTAITENPAADAKKLIKSCIRTFPPELQSDLLTVIKR